MPQGVIWKLKFPDGCLILRESDLQTRLMMARFKLSKLFGGDATPEQDDPDQLEKILAKLAAERADANAIKQATPTRCQLLVDGDEAGLTKIEAEIDGFHRQVERADLLREEIEPRLHAAREKAFQAMRAEAISRHKAALGQAFAKLRDALSAVGVAQDEMLATHQSAHDELHRYGAANTLPSRLCFNGYATGENIQIFLDAAERELCPPVVAPSEALRTVEFVKPYRSYAPAEVAAFPASEAVSLVDRGLARWADRRPKPEAPTVEGDKPATIRFRRKAWLDGRLYAPSDQITVAAAMARRLLQGGTAELVQPGGPEPSAYAPSAVGTPAASAPAATTPSAGPQGGYLGLQQRGE